MKETNRSRVDRILQKLQQVRQRKLSCFGSDSHGFRLNNPLSETDIQAFETSHNIRLPDDYRTFFAYAGNGGAGPYYGIFPLDKWDDFADWVIDEKPDNFLSILNDSQAADDHKSEAANAFCRLPRLSDVAARKIPEYLDSPIVGVRAGILATIHKFKLGSIEAVARLLDDPHPDVRRAAICAVMTSRSQYWIKSKYWINEVLNRLYEETDESFAQTAFFQLEEAEAFSKPELLRILNQSPCGSLRQLAAYEVKWNKEDLPLLILLLSDSHTMVRFYATLGLRELNARNSLPQVLELLSKEKDDLVVGSILKMLGEFQDRSSVPVLLEWAENEDDFHCLDAIDALAKIGDERVIPIARTMLLENRPPNRWDNESGLGSSSVHSIGKLVRESLKESPNKALRNLVG